MVKIPFSLLLPLVRVDAFVGQSSPNLLNVPPSVEQPVRYQNTNPRCKRARLFNAAKEQAENEENMKQKQMSPVAVGDRISVDEPKNDIRFASPLIEFGYPPAVEDLEDGYTSSKPLLLYIPGFDGTYLSAFFQYPELHSIFDVRCLVSTMQDRSSFDELKQSILEFLAQNSKCESGPQNLNGVQNSISLTDDECNVEEPKGKMSFSTFVSGMLNQQKQDLSSKKFRIGGRPVYLAGESFGGILACEVALDLLKTTSINFQGLVLINAATCYDRSRLAAAPASPFPDGAILRAERT